jgi:hypothetical protein
VSGDVKVCGYSDDLIEVEGDTIREEFPLATYIVDNKVRLLAFSQGTVLRITYTDKGVWRITLVCGVASIVQAPEEVYLYDEDNYSDVATVPGPVAWVVCGEHIAKASP